MLPATPEEKADQEEVLFDCPISLEPYEGPVLLPTGQSVNLSIILKWLYNNIKNPFVPQSQLSSYQLIPNPAIALLQDAREALQKDAQSTLEVFYKGKIASIPAEAKELPTNLDKEQQLLEVWFNFLKSNWSFANICPLSLKNLQDPVTTSQGLTYEKHAIHSWLEQNPTDPLTKKPLSKRDLIPNLQLKSILALPLFKNLPPWSNEFLTLLDINKEKIEHNKFSSTLELNKENFTKHSKKLSRKRQLVYLLKQFFLKHWNKMLMLLFLPGFSVFRLSSIKDFISSLIYPLDKATHTEQRFSEEGFEQVRRYFYSKERDVAQLKQRLNEVNPVYLRKLTRELLARTLENSFVKKIEKYINDLLQSFPAYFQEQENDFLTFIVSEATRRQSVKAIQLIQLLIKYNISFNSDHLELAVNNKSVELEKIFLKQGITNKYKALPSTTAATLLPSLSIQTMSASKTPLLPALTEETTCTTTNPSTTGIFLSLGLWAASKLGFCTRPAEPVTIALAAPVAQFKKAQQAEAAADQHLRKQGSNLEAALHHLFGQHYSRGDFKQKKYLREAVVDVINGDVKPEQGRIVNRLAATPDIFYRTSRMLELANEINQAKICRKLGQL